VSLPPYDECNLARNVGDEPGRVAENRARVAARAGLGPPETWRWLDQVHGATVVVADEPPEVVPPLVQADASVTTTRGRVLALLTADCAPVVLASDDSVAVVHVGWRGLVAGVLEAAVGALRARGHGRVRAFVGPCIRPERYEFGARDLADVEAALGARVGARTLDGRPALDIPAAVGVVLVRAGVEDVEDSRLCTAASPELFSHRRDGVTGRQATLAWLP
jgi:YfiH family protein